MRTTKTIKASPKKYVVAKTRIKFGENVRKDEDGFDVCDITIIEAGAVLPFDPRDPKQAEKFGCTGLREGVHYEMSR